MDLMILFIYLWIFIQDSLFSSQGELLSMRVLRKFPIWTQESFTQHLPTRQPPLWFIDIALKLGAQLSISITIFQVFGMTRLWLELTTFRSGGEHSTCTLPVGIEQ